MPLDVAITVVFPDLEGRGLMPRVIEEGSCFKIDMFPQKIMRNVTRGSVWNDIQK